MLLPTLLASLAWAAEPLSVSGVEWSSVAAERPAEGEDPTAWVRDALAGAGHPEGAAGLQLGGFVSAAVCQVRSRTTCEVAVRWTLREPLTGSTRYTVLTRGLGAGLQPALADATARVLERERFRAATAEPAPSAAGLEPIVMRRCASAPQALPSGMKAALATTLFVKTPAGSGSGVLISPDGFVLTAAHVVAGQPSIEVRSPGGAAVTAALVATDARQDVALLRLEGGERACLPAAVGAAEVGTELYAVGSPLGETLEFSVSKGIVSGARRVGDVRFLQTDASLNPGNSGGPLVGIDGRLLAVVSWKVAAEGLEGLGFGVPVEAAMQSLALEWGDASVVPTGRTAESARPVAPTVRDTDDPPRLDATRAADIPGRRADRSGFILGGVLLGAVGASAVLGTYVTYATTPEMTADSWTLLQIGNTAGWVAVAAGGTLLVIPMLTDTPGLAVQGRF